MVGDVLVVPIMSRDGVIKDFLMVDLNIGKDQAWYFGADGGKGHYLRGHRGQSQEAIPKDFPCRVGVLDTGFLPPAEEQIEGRATLATLNGWTVMAFWDRSVDTRRGSNSAFCIRGTHTFDEMVGIAKECFPAVWNRFKFEVRLRDH